MGLKERSAARRKRIVGHIARNFEDAEQWDLEFWQSQTPAMRLLTIEVARQHVKMMHSRNKMFDKDLEPDWAERGYLERIAEEAAALAVGRTSLTRRGVRTKAVASGGISRTRRERM
jgi:hypothetical protein